MDIRDFRVIENEKISKQTEIAKTAMTNPIAKKFVKFHNEKKFSVRNLFKNVSD